MTTITFKCPNCGGGLQFDPASQKYKCEYCTSLFSQEELEALAPEAAADRPEEAREKNGPEQENTDHSGKTEKEDAQALIYTCPSCGAEIVTDATTAATFCFYCHNPVVLMGRLGGEYEPDYIVPFSIDREKARDIFLKWLKQKKFVPSSFYSPSQIDKMTGVYFPYWSYSCHADGKLEGQASREVSSRISGSVRYIENEKFRISRSGSLDVDGVTRNALKKADRKLAEGVMPYEIKERKPFSMGYLSGFIAEKRDMEKDQFTEEVKKEVEDYAVSRLRSSVTGYDSVQIERQEVSIRDSKWDYILMPVWTLTYKDSASGTIYYFACNGQTGKVCGRLPVDRRKLVIFFLEIFLPLFIILLVVGYFI